MKKTKLLILITILFIVVGIAAVTTNLIVNVSTPISANTDDFDVYFSDVYVDGTQDLSLVNNTRELVFKYKLSAVGDKKTINYDITNASKNYDALITMSCTESNTYLKITNAFDTENPISARSTKQGTLSIELLTAVSEEVSYEVKCTINASAVERETQNDTIVPDHLPKSYVKGNEIDIAGEKFNIISSTDTTVTLLAQYNLDNTYRQSETLNRVTFSESNGWEKVAGASEIDIQAYDGNVKTYVNEYVSFLKQETKDTTITGTLITLSDLKGLGCSITDDNSGEGIDTCANSEHSEWLLKGQMFWTRSVFYNSDTRIMGVVVDGTIYTGFYDGIGGGVRPVITISKAALEETI